MRIPLAPVPKPRMTQRDRWAKRPAVVRYYEFCDLLRNEWVNLTDDQAVPPVLVLRFNIPMPQSWSRVKKESMRGGGHQQRPDIDNLIKAFLDALCEDDSYVYSVTAEKYWSDEGSIEVENF